MQPTPRFPTIYILHVDLFYFLLDFLLDFDFAPVREKDASPHSPPCCDVHQLIVPARRLMQTQRPLVTLCDIHNDITHFDGANHVQMMIC